MTDQPLHDPVGSAGRRRRLSNPEPKRRRQGRFAPYLLLSPALVIVLAVFGLPLVMMFLLSLQNWNSVGQFTSTLQGAWTGFSNYTSLLSSSTFWSATLRTIVVSVLMVGGSMVVGLLFAFLMRQISTWARYILTFSLILVWSIPALVSTFVFQWMFNRQYGIINDLLGYNNVHDWLTSETDGWFIVITLVIWGAVPMVTIMMYAALTQVPKELVEAAHIDGANGWQTFRSVVEPIIRPVVLIMTSLSVFWDFQVFTQIFVLFSNQPQTQFYNLGVWSYVLGWQHQNYGIATTITVLTMIIMLVVTVPYLRQLVRIGGDSK
jgi:N,N'-diacetylchitobiose transport system permease protein